MIPNICLTIPCLFSLFISLRDSHALMDDDINGTFMSVLGPEDLSALSSHRRPSNAEGELSARDHPYYKRNGPDADGFYHCPWEGNPTCNHKPEKLKCNYE